MENSGAEHMSRRLQRHVSIIHVSRYKSETRFRYFLRTRFLVNPPLDPNPAQTHD